MRFLRTLFSCSAAAFVLAAATLTTFRLPLPRPKRCDSLCAYPYWFGFAPTRRSCCSAS